MMMIQLAKKIDYRLCTELRLLTDRDRTLELAPSPFGDALKRGAPLPGGSAADQRPVRQERLQLRVEVGVGRRVGVLGAGARGRACLRPQLLLRLAHDLD